MHKSVKNIIDLYQNINKKIKDLNYSNYNPQIIAVSKTFSMKNKNQEKNLIEMVKQNCRKIIKNKTGKKPFTNINIARL